MKNRWNHDEAARFAEDPLQMRVYTSRLIGSDEDLVLHGGGNTSVKTTIENLFGEPEDVLYVKGSGWDLATIEAAGFAPVKLDVLKRMAELDKLSDTDMVKYQRAAMLDPSAPNPSVEAILHAIIPFRYVDHTHADAVVTISNTADGEQRIRDLYGNRVVLIPYVMPGFVLARKVAEMTSHLDWSRLEGMVLMNHGVFSFADQAKTSYERMISLVQTAETCLRDIGTWDTASATAPSTIDAGQLSRLRKFVSKAAGKPMICAADNGEVARGFSRLADMEDVATRGPLTPDHVIRTKRIPLIVDAEIEQVMERYVAQYKAYFDANTNGELTCLDPAPRWAVWPDTGVLAFGATVREAEIVADISRHTIRCIQWAESLGGWSVLDAKHIFEVEYWDLEQAKLRKGGARSPLSGRVALVTGAASGIGKACVNSLLFRGAAVIALDLNGDIVDLFGRPEVLGLTCDVCNTEALGESVRSGICAFGGLDIVISNAGMFPASQAIADMDDATWNRSIELNLSSHQRLLTATIPYLKYGIEPAIVVVGSKNVPAPGPGASAYSAAKAGLNQLARVAALELATDGIRVNVVHPNAVFDTGIWTDEVLASRAASYGLSVDEYKKNNMLRTEVGSNDVAEMVCEMAGPLFAKTTGAQIPVDGGNERVV
jgi:rhamnose utilization protein RhaD (predicted bifunctional aldolase and dehydrogenase)/NAD(P)-dependent dehydrogenase (short-subunit alcohol dehydrogenase family)